MDPLRLALRLISDNSRGHHSRRGLASWASIASLTGALACSPPAEDTKDAATGQGSTGVSSTEGASTGETGSESTTGHGWGFDGSSSESTGEPDPQKVCLGTEPEGERVTAFDCAPCSEDEGISSAIPRWLVARIDLPSAPYRVEALGAVLEGPSPTDLVYFVGDNTLPNPQPVFNTVQVEHDSGITRPRLATAILDEPLTVGESEHLFVGVYLDGETWVRGCDSVGSGETKVWMRDDPPAIPWTTLHGTAPQFQAYGGPE